MGLLAELEKLNPTAVIADLEAAKAKLIEYEQRLQQLETIIGQVAPAIQALVRLIPGAKVPAEVSALLGE